MEHLWLFLNSDYSFLANGEPHRSLAFQFRIHDSCVSVIVRQTLHVICDRLEKVAIPEPNGETLEQTVDVYHRRWHFPHCCGSIDGKHIRIISPGNSETLCFNYKDFHSIVCSCWLIITTNSWQFMSVFMGRTEMLGYLSSNLLGIIFHKLLNSHH